MCELFGYSSSKPFAVNDYLKDFYSHCNCHPHGWGLALLDSQNYSIYKEPINARRSLKLKKILDNPIMNKNVFAHIRFATIGNLTLSNCHPFYKKDDSGRMWTLIHNGTIFDSSDLCKYAMVQEGTTDSERILLYIVDEINKREYEKGESLSIKERFNLISNLVNNLSFNNKLDLMLFDGEYFYVHMNCKDSLHYLKSDSSIMFSTKPLNNGHWEDVPLNTLLCYKDGNLVFKSKPHNNEYIETPEQSIFIKKFLKSLDNVSEGEYVW
ncbi:class II glutamine amidotransferase [Methanobrevibacter sp. 87.7]|uniref:class II glutamine amidotransferase n=1 Tax=Methanobrevibacter sp. 87.7 TaxID=387957 RepID=UPI000B514B1A|nr:class II glutamine amidotransferase [Methanobrevibacter sp. 87.7]OWT32764.1 class II glutamine amidotransferase [Methanobrevibacter sp. 87.7]